MPCGGGGSAPLLLLQRAIIHHGHLRFPLALLTRPITSPSWHLQMRSKRRACFPFCFFICDSLCSFILSWDRPGRRAKGSLQCADSGQNVRRHSLHRLNASIISKIKSFKKSSYYVRVQHYKIHIYMHTLSPSLLTLPNLVLLGVLRARAGVADGKDAALD